jgi:hypothetical protein
MANAIRSTTDIDSDIEANHSNTIIGIDVSSSTNTYDDTSNPINNNSSSTTSNPINNNNSTNNDDTD